MDEFDIHIFLNAEDEADYYQEIIGAALELLESGRISEACFYLRAGLGEEVEDEH